MKSTKTKGVSYYMSLPYARRIIKQSKNRYFAEVEELPGCMAQGISETDALANLEKSMRIWFKRMVEKDIPIPLPIETREYSGKFLVRLPTYIHKRLVNSARNQRISLNQYVVTLLTEQSSLSSVEEKIDHITQKIKEQTRAYELMSDTWTKIQYGKSQKDIIIQRDIPKKTWGTFVGITMGGEYGT